MDLVFAYVAAMADKSKSLRQGPQPNEETITAQPDIPSSDSAAVQFVKALQKTEPDDPTFHERLNEIVSTVGWTQGLAKAILDGIHEVVKSGEKMGHVMTEASEKALVMVEKFVKKYPHYTVLVAGGTLIGLVVLAFMAPRWMMKALPFITQVGLASRLMMEIAEANARAYRVRAGNGMEAGVRRNERQMTN